MKPKVAMRMGDWKILARLDQPEAKQTAAIKKAELTTFERYNLGGDLGETTDLAGKEPERLTAMAEALGKLYREVRDEGPAWRGTPDPRCAEGGDLAAMETEGKGAVAAKWTAPCLGDGNVTGTV
jgi:hypothetical protein